MAKRLKSYRLDEHLIEAIGVASRASGLSEAEIVRGAIATRLGVPITAPNTKRRKAPNGKPLGPAGEPSEPRPHSYPEAAGGGLKAKAKARTAPAAAAHHGTNGGAGDGDEHARAATPLKARITQLELAGHTHAGARRIALTEQKRL